MLKKNSEQQLVDMAKHAEENLSYESATLFYAKAAEKVLDSFSEFTFSLERLNYMIDHSGMYYKKAAENAQKAGLKKTAKIFDQLSKSEGELGYKNNYLSKVSVSELDSLRKKEYEIKNIVSVDELVLN